MNNHIQILRRIKLLTWLFIIGLVVSGVTAIPLQSELNLLVNFFGSNGESSEMARWFLRVHDALAQTQAQHPFLFYGTDWLAFGHFVIAMVFIGGLRGIPFWWRLIDCSFGVFGFIPLWFCRKWAMKLEKSALR